MDDLASTTRSTRRYDAIPGPPRAGLGGHLPEWLGVENARGVLQRLSRYAATCGPLARVDLGPVRMLLVADARLAATVLDDERANYKGAAYILTRAVLDNVLLLNGSAWASHRKAYRQALRDVDVMRVSNDVSTRYLERARRGDFTRADGHLMLDDFASRLVGDVVAGFVASQRLDDSFEPHRRRIQYELAGLGIDLQCQPWRYLSPMRWALLRRSVAHARAFFGREAERRLVPGAASPQDDVLAGFSRLAREGLYPQDATALQDGAVNFFFTAHDVLTSSTSWCLHLLARHPSIQAELRRELDRLPTDRLDKDALEGCDLLGRVVRESLRLYPGYALFGRTTQADMRVGDHHVPRGTMIIVSPFVIHRMERHFADATRFVPERWTGIRAPIGPAPKDQYMPFGAGARACLASHLAVPIMKTIVARVVRDLELRTDAEHEPKIVYWGTAYAEAGLPVRARPAWRAPGAPEPQAR